MQLIPRFRGNAYQVKSHWEWELMITIPTQKPFFVGSKEKFVDRDSALLDLRKTCSSVIKELCEIMGLQPDGVLDLNEQKAMSFSEFESDTHKRKEVLKDVSIANFNGC